MQALKFALRVLAGMPVWFAYTVLMVPLILLGLVLVPLLAVCDQLGQFYAPFPITWVARFSQQYKGRMVLAWRWRWMWLWGNEEDGIDGAANDFWPPVRGLQQVYQIIAWSALRNSVGNARWTVFGITTDPHRVHFLALGALDVKRGPYIAWQGLCYELRFPWPGGKRFFWLGWRIAQQSAMQFTPGVGFAFQPWGTI